MTAKVFLAHASDDKERVRDIHAKLRAEGFRPWLDAEDLIPGQVWHTEIEKAIQASDVFLACLSKQSVAKAGYVQREFRMALTEYANKPPGRIYLIPVKLDDCELPDHEIPNLGIRLRDIQWLDYYKPDGLQRLVNAIKTAVGRTDIARPVPGPSEEQQKLEVEIGHRVPLLGVLLADIFTFTQLHTAKGAVVGKSEERQRVGKLGNFDPLFPEFLNTTLFSLLWRLRQIVADEQKATLDQPLASAKELPQYFDRLVMLAPVGEEDSKWQVDRQHLDALRTALAGLRSARWAGPPRAV